MSFYNKGTTTTTKMKKLNPLEISAKIKLIIKFSNYALNVKAAQNNNR